MISCSKKYTYSVLSSSWNFWEGNLLFTHDIFTLDHIYITFVFQVISAVSPDNHKCELRHGAKRML